MKVEVLTTPEKLGLKAAQFCSSILNDAIKTKGKARIILSTGASQISTLKALVQTDINWNRVEMFHLDEYINLPESHPASFRRYLKERFTRLVNLKEVHFVNDKGDLRKNIDLLSNKIMEESVDLALIGIGENAHVAFNDPPADFETNDPFLTVNLDEDCKKQQVREGWFSSIAEVPNQAITMSVNQILKSKAVISCVPFKVKAHAVKLTLENEVMNRIPSTVLKTHPEYTLLLDKDSASEVDQTILEGYRG
jgi:glucosamine-6-phosphate deaminase